MHRQRWGSITKPDPHRVSGPAKEMPDKTHHRHQPAGIRSICRGGTESCPNASSRLSPTPRLCPHPCPSLQDLAASGRGWRFSLSGGSGNMPPLPAEKGKGGRLPGPPALGGVPPRRLPGVYLGRSYWVEPGSGLPL